MHLLQAMSRQTGCDKHYHAVKNFNKHMIGKKQDTKKVLLIKRQQNK